MSTKERTSLTKGKKRQREKREVFREPGGTPLLGVR